MENLTRRLMLQNRTAQANLPTAIFGTASSISQTIYADQPPVRIGLWPVICHADPQLGMGIFTVLSYLLERYQGVRVYRICAMLEGQPETYNWQISQSQFDVDDWQLEGLDDNVGIWGSLEGLDHAAWKLTVSVEDDLAHSDEDAETFSLSADSANSLIRHLPRLVADIADYLELELKIVAPVYHLEDKDAGDLRDALVSAFEWELKLYLYLWGKAWNEDHMLHDVDGQILQIQTAGSVGAWLCANGMARLMIYTEAASNEIFLPPIHQAIEKFKPDPTLPIILATSLYESRLTEESYDMLVAEIDGGRAESLTYLALAELYRRSGRANDAVDTMQEAIEADAVSAALYQRYADVLIAMEYGGHTYDTFVLIDPDETRQDRLLWEAIEAYDAALHLDPANPALLSRQILQLTELDSDDKRLWARFEQIVQNDSTGEYVRPVVDAFYNLEDLQPAITALKKLTDQQPDRVDGYINLAVIYTFAEDNEAALDMLHKARELTDDEDVLADIQRLTFLAEDPDFEMRLGEISAVVNAGNDLTAEDVEFLEDILEQAPSFAEAYVLLAKAYIGWDEPGTALETLMDGHRHVPDDPEIIALLSQQLWETGEQDTALSYLDKGIRQNPQHVALLALAGQYLFEDGQEDAAKAYLVQAEAISPRDPTLAQVRVHIARLLGQ